MEKDVSPIVSGKMYRLTIEGAVPIEIANMPEAELAASIINGFNVNLGVVGTITNFNCKLLQQIPPKSQRQ